jgi:glycosyltransferase involved in cell wall biosynthesis
LRSIKLQTYQNLEIIVVDGTSNDRTVEFAKSFGAQIVNYGKGLLGARYAGFKKSRGDFALLLDSDQILEKTAVERANLMMKSYDAICLEEDSYRPRTFVQKLFESDRRIINKLWKTHIDPVEGVLLARFYRRVIAETAFENIPKLLFPIVVAHDHAIINFEAFKISNRVGMLPRAVWHMEPVGLIDLWAKNYRYGKSARVLSRTGLYGDLIKKKMRFRKEALRSGELKSALQSYLLLVLKGTSFQLGYIRG